MKRPLLLTMSLVAVLALCRPTSGADAGPVDYLRSVKPLLAARCYACHGGLQQRAGLRLDTATLIRKGSDIGPVIVPGKRGESALLDRVGTTGRGRMPPQSEGEPLKEA